MSDWCDTDQPVPPDPADAYLFALVAATAFVIGTLFAKLLPGS